VSRVLHVVRGFPGKSVHLSPLWLLDSIWSSVMKTFCDRRERVQTSPDVTNQIKAGFEADTRSADDTEQFLQMRVLYKSLMMLEKIGLWT
jgi:hypothetical protein